MPSSIFTFIICSLLCRIIYLGSLYVAQLQQKRLVQKLPTKLRRLTLRFKKSIKSRELRVVFIFLFFEALERFHL